MSELLSLSLSFSGTKVSIFFFNYVKGQIVNILGFVGVWFLLPPQNGSIVVL